MSAPPNPQKIAIKLGARGGGVQKKRGAARPAVAAAFIRAKGEEESEIAADLQARKVAASRLKDEGNALAEGGDLRAALSKWDNAVTLDANNAVLQELRSQAFLGLGEWWPAVQAAERATMIDPEFGEGWVTLGRAQLNLGEFGMAIASFERATSLVGAVVAAELGVPADLEQARALKIKQATTGWRRPGCAASRQLPTATVDSGGGI